MMTAKTISAVLPSDADLVGETLAGNRDAFGRIVARYQSLICSLAYSTTGSLSQSEDLAQETFIAAWKQLAQLRDPERLRGWLCGIARNRINNFLRREAREPVQKAEPLENLSEPHAPEPLPPDYVMSREEEGILWRSLQTVPQIYREPLVLFYREHQSVEHVAKALELSEDAVHQRLSRGRKMLQEQVLAFIESALERTAPGGKFTLSVMAALPTAAASMKAATIGATLAKGGAMAKGMAMLGYFISGCFIGLGGFYVQLKGEADDTKSPRERQFCLRMNGILISVYFVLIPILVVSVAVAAPLGIERFGRSHHPLAYEVVMAAFLFAMAVVVTMLFEHRRRRQWQIQVEEGTWVEAEWISPRKDVEPALKSAGNWPKFKKYIQTARFKAVILSSVAIVFITKLWGLSLVWTFPVLIIWLLWFISDFRAWQTGPRYEPRDVNWLIGMAVAVGLGTLLLFNADQYTTPTGSLITNTSNGLPQSAMAIFNTSVVLVYTGFIWVLVWRRKRESLPKINEH